METSSSERVCIVSNLFTIAVNDFHAKKSVRYNWVLIPTEPFVNRTQCMYLQAY